MIGKDGSTIDKQRVPTNVVGVGIDACAKRRNETPFLREMTDV